jgi:hypothetical protein
MTLNGKVRRSRGAKMKQPPTSTKKTLMGSSAGCIDLLDITSSVLCQTHYYLQPIKLRL